MEANNRMEHTIDEILAALARQVEVYRRLAKLARTQHEHVQDGRTEDLLRVLAQRQEALDELAGLERSLASAKQRWADFLEGLEPAARKEAERLLGQTRQLLEEITTADRNDALVLQQRKLDLGRQIDQATAARRVNRQYAAAAYGPQRAAFDVKR